VSKKKKSPKIKKRKLVLYSGGQSPTNKVLHNALVNLGRKKAKSMTYIPYSHENGEYFYKRIKKRYRQFGIRKFNYFAVDSDFLRKEMNEALKSDIIYLAGGNTFYFLKHLRESGFLPRLQKFIRGGGIVAGLSAGAIILTPNIYMAAYPKHDCDVNEVRLKNLHSIGAVDFEFFPHYVPSAKTHRSMIRYSRQTERMIVACPDGSGVVVHDTEVRFVGPVYLYYRGHRTKLS
jgi:dipeptidase E